MPQNSYSRRYKADSCAVFPPLALTARSESLPLAKPFQISRGSKSAADVVLVHVEGAGISGRGEAVPYARYNETIKACLTELQAIGPRLEQGLRHEDLTGLLPAGAARNALDCALWDWKAKAYNRSVSDMLGLEIPDRTLTAFTITLASPSDMADQAAQAAHMPLLKLKLGDAPGDADRLIAIRAAVPKSRLIVDANEGWSADDLARLAPLAHELGVELIEQPLPADRDAVLSEYKSPVPLCADESFQGNRSLEDLARLYQAINIKLDKTGGLSTAIAVAKKAQALGFDIFLGCMVASSLAMAPALHLAGLARWVDLDGPLLLARDRTPGLKIDNGYITDMPRGLWGLA